MMRSRARQAAFWLLAATVLTFSLAPSPQDLPTTGWDKSNHFVGFFALAVAGLFAYPSRGALMLAGLLAFGGAIEILQGLGGVRRAEWGDWIADAVGILAGYAAMHVVRRRRR